MNKQKISVALCTFNGERYLDVQLQSILNQTLPPDEIIICDDCSTDKTLNILKSYSSQYPDKIFSKYNQENLGTIRNFEQAISLTSGDLIFLSDQDDIWHSDKIEKTILLFNKNPETLLIFSNGELIDENGKVLGSTLWDKWNFTNDIRSEWKSNKSAFSDLLRNINKVTGATVVFRKDLKAHIFPFKVPKDYWHDAWLALHASALNGLNFTEESLIQYRIHSNQQIGVPGIIRTSIHSSKSHTYVSYDEFYREIKEKYPPMFSKTERLIRKIKKINKKVLIRFHFK